MASELVAEYAPDEVLPSNYWMNAEGTDSYAQYLIEFKSYIDQNVVAFITGQQDIAAGWGRFSTAFAVSGSNTISRSCRPAYAATR